MSGGVPAGELLPCPFCGGEARLYPVIIPFDADCDAITIQCVGCDAIGANVLVDQDVHGQCDLQSLEAEAITAWNTRATPPIEGRDADVERVARALCVADGLDPDEHIVGGQATGFEDFGPLWQAEDRSEGQLGLTDYTRLARAALQALGERG